MLLDSLVLSLPARNSTMRMRVWRTLNETGCVVLRYGLYVLPAGSSWNGILAALDSAITAAGGFSMNV